MDKRGNAVLKNELLSESSRGSLAAGLAAVGFVLCMVAAPSPAHARWTITPTTTLQGAYSDNTNLTATNEQDDYILTAIGQLSVEGNFSRLDSFFDYTLAYDTYGSTNGLDGERHTLAMRNQFSVVSDFLYFNLNGDLRERQSSRSVVTPVSSRTFQGSQVRVTSINAGPQLSTVIGNAIALDANVEYSYVDFSDTSVGTGAAAFADDEIWRGGVSLSNIDSGNVFTWALSASGWDDNKGRSNFDGLATAQYLLTPSLAAVARVGYDAADTDGDGVNNIETEHWRLGFEYRPSTRTSMRLEAGQRFDQSSYNAEIRHSLKRGGSFYATYSHLLQTDTLRFATDSNLDRLDDLGNPVPVSDIIQDIINTSYIVKDGRVGLNGQTGLMSYNVQAYHQQREYQNFPVEDTVVGGSVDVTRNFGSQFYATVNASISVDDRTNALTEVDRTRGSLAVGYNISATAAAQLAVGMQKNEFGTGTEVTETVVSFLITKTW